MREALELGQPLACCQTSTRGVAACGNEDPEVVMKSTSESPAPPLHVLKMVRMAG
jgi:hypothetical protein